MPVKSFPQAQGSWQSPYSGVGPVWRTPVEWPHKPGEVADREWSGQQTTKIWLNPSTCQDL